MHVILEEAGRNSRLFDFIMVIDGGVPAFEVWSGSDAELHQQFVAHVALPEGIALCLRRRAVPSRHFLHVIPALPGCIAGFRHEGKNAVQNPDCRAPVRLDHRHSPRWV